MKKSRVKIKFFNFFQILVSGFTQQISNESVFQSLGAAVVKKFTPVEYAADLDH